MALRRLAFAFGTLVLTTCSPASAAQKYQYFIDATNRLTELTSQSMSPGREALERATAEACHALGQLMEDPDFKKDLARLAESGAKTQAERARMKKDLRLFGEAFLRVEEESLRKAGLSEQATKEILSSASRFRNALDDKYDPDRILGSIDRLRAEVCAGARTLQQAEDKSRRMATVRKWGLRIGGIALIVVDLTVAAPTGPVAVGSVAIGTAVGAWAE